MTFVLRGYDSPTGEYPSPVVPVGTRDGTLCVSYRTSEGVEFVDIPPHAKFVPRTGPDFDVERDALFAFAPHDVVSYAFQDEMLFFDAALQDPRMIDSCPFFRLSLAIETGHEDLIATELPRALRRMQENAPHYAHVWWDSTLSRLGSEWPKRSVELFKHGHTFISARAVLAPVLFAEKAFDREVLRLHKIVRHTSRNGKLEQLEELRRTVARDVTVRLVGSRTAELEQYLQVPGLRYVSAWEESDLELGSHLPRVPLRRMLHEGTWFDRVQSGMAQFEESIARKARNEVRVPRLRTGIDSAAHIATEHVTELYGRQIELVEEESSDRSQMQRLQDAWKADTRLAGERCVTLIRRELDDWWPPRFPPFTITAAILEFDLRCRNRMTSVLGDYLTAPLSSGYHHPHLAQFITRLADRVRATERAPHRREIGLPAVSLYTGLAASAAIVSFVISGAVTEKVKDELLRRYRQAIDQWVETTHGPSEFDNFGDQLKSSRNAEMTEIRDLITDTTFSIERLNSMRVLLDQLQ